MDVVVKGSCITKCKKKKREINSVDLTLLQNTRIKAKKIYDCQ